MQPERSPIEQIRDVYEQYDAQGWTDGLPIVPPTQARVDQFLAAAGMSAEETAVTYASRQMGATAQMLAVNAVMAGCLPEHFPYVCAAARAVTAPEFLLNHIATTSSAFPLTIVHGPRGRALGFNSGAGVFSPGNRSNATVGRALSLILANCFDARPGGIQGGNQGHPARYGFCIAENEESGWTPLHVLRGFAPSDNAVTVFPSQASPFPLEPLDGCSAEEAAGRIMVQLLRIGPALTYYVLTISPALQRLFAREGWAKEDLRRYLLERSQITVAELKRRGRWRNTATERGMAASLDRGDEERVVFPFRRDELRREIWHEAELQGEPDILIIVAGGDRGVRASVVTSHAAGPQPVTLRIQTNG